MTSPEQEQMAHLVKHNQDLMDYIFFMKPFYVKLFIFISFLPSVNVIRYNSQR